MSSDALIVGGGVTSPVEARLASSGLLAPQGPTVLDVRTGVLAGPGSTALITGTTDTAPMTVQIGVHVTVGSRGTANGPYIGPTLEAPLKVNIGAAPGTGGRIDVVYSKQQDGNSGVPSPDVTTAPLYGVLAGVASSSPVKPALSTIVGATELGTVQVNAGATSTSGANVTITQTARQTVARGARLPVTNQADRDALQAFPGLEVYRLDTGQVQLCTSISPSTVWVTTYDPAAFPGTFPAAFAHQSAAQTGLASGWNVMTLQTKDIDSASAVNANGRFTVPAGQAGTFAVEGGVAFGAVASGAALSCAIRKNGAVFAGCIGTTKTAAAALAAGQSEVTGRKILTLAVSDYVEVWGFNNGGSWATLASADEAPWMSVERIR